MVSGPISIHAPHTGRDLNTTAFANGDEDFNPRAPYGARLRWLRCIRSYTANFNPRAPYGARLKESRFTTPLFSISIHAPHTGRDFDIDKKLRDLCDISIHAPHTGRDARCVQSETVQVKFQSTRPIRGATTRARIIKITGTNFNPRAPYGARQQKCIIYVLHFCNNRQLKHKNQQETSSVRTFF